MSEAYVTGSYIIVSGARINIEKTMKYLDHLLDSWWQFELHFQGQVPKLMKTAAVFLGELYPNSMARMRRVATIHRRDDLDDSLRSPSMGRYHEDKNRCSSVKVAYSDGK
ncbi:hypothetical protein EVAR_39017_1 [Eumeta japonica]|uniref:Uncharacterized protein n=1 Tax=Eumeta variegata TaxID=151549 RepID=A0A4C1WPC8_EUMVA|nr:hypothetical protein EVAR_39017_1 [Eumeta japonica]